MLIRTDSNPIDAAQRIAWLNPLITLSASLLLYVDSFFAPLVEPLTKGSKVQIHPLEFHDLQTRRDILSANPQMPMHRNEQKDTLQYMCLMNAKAEVVAAAVAAGHVTTPFVAYIDSGISKVFKSPETIKEIETLSFRDIPFLLVPGCHTPQSISRDQLANQINWSYSGGFFVLPTERAAEFASLHRAAIETFLVESRITWEVNIWTYWLTGRPDVIWYSGPHNDLMIAGIPPAQKFRRRKNSTMKLLGE